MLLGEHAKPAAHKTGKQIALHSSNHLPVRPPCIQTHATGMSDSVAMASTLRSVQCARTLASEQASVSGPVGFISGATPFIVILFQQGKPFFRSHSALPKPFPRMWRFISEQRGSKKKGIHQWKMWANTQRVNEAGWRNGPYHRHASMVQSASV